MTQTADLMAGITRHGEQIRQLSKIGVELRESGDGAGYSKVRAALSAIFIERDIKRIRLARLCDDWFRVQP